MPPTAVAILQIETEGTVLIIYLRAPNASPVTVGVNVVFFKISIFVKQVRIEKNPGFLTGILV